MIRNMQFVNVSNANQFNNMRLAGPVSGILNLWKLDPDTEPQGFTKFLKII